MDAFLCKDVSTFSSLYTNVSIFFDPGHFIVCFKIGIRLYSRVFPHFRPYTRMNPHFFQPGHFIVFLQNVDTSPFKDVSTFLRKPIKCLSPIKCGCIPLHRRKRGYNLSKESSK